MPAIYSTKKEFISVIRRLASVNESDIVSFVTKKGWPLASCTFCDSVEDLKRQKMAKLLVELSKTIPDIKNSIFASLKNVYKQGLLDLEL